MTTQTQDLRFGDAERNPDPREAAHPHWRTEEAVMKWYGWGSAVGMGILLISIGLCAVLLRYAILGG